MKPKYFLLLILIISSISVHAQQKGYYRTPCIYGNTIIFTAEGDLWKYDLSVGGIASRLTTHPGMEINPVISPDGKQIAFLGQYEGATEVYVMNINGGVPRRVTYEYDGNGMQISGWTKEGKILYRTDKYSQQINTVAGRFIAWIHLLSSPSSAEEKAPSLVVEPR